MNVILNGRGYKPSGEAPPMPVQRKVFRIEENPRAMLRGATVPHEASAAPLSGDYLAELRALRALIEPRLPPQREAMERARAQIVEADAYRRELAMIYAAIESSMPAMATLGGADQTEPQLARACRELDAIVASTEQATQAILRAAEGIDAELNALRGAGNNAEQRQLAQDIRDRVAEIYEACNFQDLTGQRVSSVLATLRRFETQLTTLIQIWRGIEQFEPVVFDEPDGDRALLNGPKLAGDAGHATQDDIDALFGCA